LLFKKKLNTKTSKLDATPASGDEWDTMNRCAILSTTAIVKDVGN